jgi:hypothetical protein
MIVFTPATSIVISEYSFENGLVSLDGNGQMDSAWPTYAHDNCHTGQSPYILLAILMCGEMTQPTYLIALLLV